MKKMAGLRLRAARLALGTADQKEMAIRLNVSATAYGNWETGERLADAAAMVRLLGLSGIGPDWIYGGVLRGVPFELAIELERRSLELGARVADPPGNWTRVNLPSSSPAPALPPPQGRKRQNRTAPRRPPTTFHEPPQEPPKSR